MPAQEDAFTANMLKRTGLMNDLQIQEAIKANHSDGKGIVGAVVRLGIAREDEFLKKLGEMLGFPYQDLSKAQPSKEALIKLPARAANQYCTLPIAIDKAGTLEVVVCDPLNTGMFDGIRLASGSPIQVTLSPPGNRKSHPEVLRRRRGLHRQDDWRRPLFRGR